IPNGSKTTPLSEILSKRILNKLKIQTPTTQKNYEMKCNLYMIFVLSKHLGTKYTRINFIDEFASHPAAL
ncbi:hypothetical protein ACJX0J_006376, partial [Zea mays]